MKLRSDSFFCILYKQSEIISVRRTSHEDNNKGLNRLRQLSPGPRVNTTHINSPKGTSSFDVRCAVFLCVPASFRPDKTALVNWASNINVLTY